MVLQGLILNEVFIDVVTALFILSLMNERIANLLKLSLHNKIIKLWYLSVAGPSFLTAKKVKFKNLAEKSFVKSEEKIREYRVMLINVFLGWVLAAIVNFDIFLVFDRDSPNGSFVNTFGWNNYVFIFESSDLGPIILGALLGVLLLFALNKGTSAEPFGVKHYEKGRKVAYSSSIVSVVGIVIAFLLTLIPSTFNIIGFEYTAEFFSYIFVGFFSFNLVYAILILIHNSASSQSGNGLFAFLFLLFTYCVSMDLIFNNIKLLTNLDTESDIKYLFTKKTFSFLLAGAFISMGSKFWHDFLDILFQLKNYRQKLLDPNTYDAPTLEAFDEYFNMQNYDLVKSVYDTHKERLLKIDGVVEVYIDLIDAYAGTYGIIVGTKPNSNPIIDTTLYYEFNSGKRYPVQVRKMSSPEIELNVIYVHNSDSISGQGSTFTAGCLVYKNSQPYLLTCAHGLIPKQEYISANVSDNQDLVKLSQTINLTFTDEPGRSPRSGRFEEVHYMVNQSMDIAIIRLNAQDVKFMKESWKDLGKHNDVVSNHTSNSVYLKRHTRGPEGIPIHGKITGRINDGSININYGQDEVSFNDVYRVEANEKFSEKGDSGSLVIDQEKNIIGIAFASKVKANSKGDHVSYVIPIEAIISQLSVTLKNNVL